MANIEELTTTKAKLADEVERLQAEAASLGEHPHMYWL